MIDNLHTAPFVTPSKAFLVTSGQNYKQFGKLILVYEVSELFHESDK
jgi:hypothetical protein